MNTMLKNNGNTNNLSSQIKQFANDLSNKGINPTELLNQLLASGKVTKEQVEQAKNLANILVNKI